MNDRSRAVRALARGLVAALVAVIAAGCSSTRVEGRWTRPGFGGTALEGPVLVIAALGDETSRRLTEDALARKLEVRGVETCKSYERLDADAARDEAALAAARQAGATHVLSSALIGRGHKTVVHPAPFSELGVGGYRRSGIRRPGYGGWVSGSYVAATTSVRHVDISVVETVLVDVASGRIEWTIRTRSVAGNTLAYDADDFSDAVLEALAAAGLLDPDR